MLHIQHIVGISEIRWAGSGHFEQDGYYVVYSGGDKSGYGGVAIILDPQTKKSLLSEDYVNDRIVMIKLDTKPTKTTIIQVYAPTSKKEADDDTDQFYEDLQSVLCTIKSKDPVIIMGDFNAKVGEGKQKEAGLGPYGLGTKNERGERLLAFCEINKLKITNTQFIQPMRRRYTWTSPRNERHQIDYILINNNWMSSCLNSKTRPGADHDTDHVYLEAKLRLKTFKCQSAEMAIKHDLEKLDDPEIRKEYTLAVENRFETLLEITDEDKRPEELMSQIKDIFLQTAEEKLGKRKGKKKKPWISSKVFELSKEKREARKNNDQTKYKRLKSEIQKNIRADKRAWLSEQCNLVGEYDRLHKSKALFRQIKETKNKKIQSSQLPIKDKSKNTLTDKSEILSRWREYGQDLFCRPVDDPQPNPPTDPPDPPIPPEPRHCFTRLKMLYAN